MKPENSINIRKPFKCTLFVFNVRREHCKTFYDLLLLQHYTCNVVICFLLNLSSTYRSTCRNRNVFLSLVVVQSKLAISCTNDVFPTHPSPNSTTLKLYLFSVVFCMILRIFFMKNYTKIIILPNRIC